MEPPKIQQLRIARPTSSQELLDDRDLEREYRLKRKTWQTMRCTRRGPAYYKLGDRCLYRREDVEKWLAGQRVEPQD